MTALQSNIYEFGEFRLDESKRVLMNTSHEIVPLTPKVFDTLLYLVRHGGAVLDKEELMKAIWPDTVVEENNLSQSISTLRRTLGETPGKHRYVVTLPGRGYRFIADVRTTTERSTASSESSMKTIAVLPFKPLVAESRDVALEMGMADTLIARLSSGQVIVRPLSSVRRYGDLDQDPLAAGRDLGVESVLDGSIQRWGDQIRVTVRLVNVHSGVSLWAGTFNEKFTDIFVVQDTISERVAGALALQPTNELKRRLTKRPTENSEAYLLYLKGRYFWEKRTQENSKRAIQYYEAAIMKDPSYALAYAGLADCYATLPVTSNLRPRGVFPKARAAALKSLEIDDSLAEAHTSLAAVRFLYEWDWKSAEAEFRCALQLNPHYLVAQRFYGYFLSSMGRHAEAVAQVRKAVDLDPVSAVSNARLGQFLYHAGEYDEALEQLLNTIELDTDFWMTHLNLGRVYERKQMYREAVAELRKTCELLETNAEAKAMLGYVLAVSGSSREAESVLQQLIQESKRQFVPRSNLAAIYAGLGDRERMHEQLEKAFEDRDVRLTFIKVEPIWNEYRIDNRFSNLLERIGFSD